MCLIIDTCSFHPVFSQNPEGNGRFAPILRWIFKGRGKLIYGGTTFANEIRGKKAAALLVELEKAGKLVQLSDPDVDAMEKVVRAKEPSPKFDDPHLVAMVAVSKCCVICTDEIKAIPYLKRQDLYPKNVKPPKIYRDKGHADLCCNNHIVAICR